MANKVLDVCRYVIEYSNDKKYGISNLKLQKVLYFIQAYFLIEKDEPCFDERIEAWDFGPVVPVAYHEYKMFGSTNIPTMHSYLHYGSNIWDVERRQYGKCNLKKNDQELINNVVDMFADYSATDLVRLTHNQDPWREAYVPYENNEITINSIKEYFNG